MRYVLRGFWSDERGATAIEYGLIVSLIAVALIAGLTQMGKNINVAFNTISNNLGSH
jgi:pilus assembly protein Flp/PilA